MLAVAFPHWIAFTRSLVSIVFALFAGGVLSHPLSHSEATSPQVPDPPCPLARLSGASRTRRNFQPASARKSLNRITTLSPWHFDINGAGLRRDTKV